MNALGTGWDWLFTAAHWHGADGIPQRLLEHLEYTGLAFAIAVLIAVPVGLAVGHTGRGTFAVTTLANLGRALPTLGLVILAFILSNGNDATVLVPLVVLAIPPVLVNTFEGVLGVDPSVRDAAAGVGMTGVQALLRVETPAALPLILLGMRTAAIQVVSTATIAAVIGLGGLGRYIIDGLSVNDYAAVSGGAILVVVLALVVQLGFGLASRVLTPAGLRNNSKKNSL